MPKEKKVRPPQRQKRQPGRQSPMRSQPKLGGSNYVGSGKLQGKAALVTGGEFRERFRAGKVATFGFDTPLGRAGEPEKSRRHDRISAKIFGVMPLLVYA